MSLRRPSARFRAWKSTLPFAGEAALNIVCLLVFQELFVLWLVGPSTRNLPDLLGGVAVMFVLGLWVTISSRRARLRGARPGQ